MLKPDLRKQALAKRSALTAQELAMLNESLLKQFKTLDLSNIKSIHIFLPIVHQKEPDTFLIIDWLQENHPGIEIVVPKADFGSSLMSHYSFKDKQDLVNNHYHIPEPQKAKPFTGIPDLVIVPLLAFDVKGFRVGYGKGFYDRFLENINTQKIGLSFFDATPEIIDVHLNDIRLDKCITPTGIIDFG
ncbi:5-formyltetrahydrofolate cyclo-ligase [Pedobacter polaris]|uniref:5-formyltetrahydrofolate cyclo-ligase n=1 Tax=Pedobacter polaris TaxID=2571273 RepID=A0A4U1CYW0_9SPHI|nr:5-formyltetrahydrofolate cyclo-ligase [Pedobacter polaris]TKC12618.1 5-formyltetrahydrofolate cyclo-ligase [Pedobacter polaris]